MFKKFAVFRTNSRLKTRIDLNLPRGSFSKLRFPERNFFEPPNSPFANGALQKPI